jgi:NAD(P)-dependent dehydrogenase (short-subunit alcohol dehydrogenase family)
LKVYITARSVSDCENTARELNAKGPGRCISLPADMQKVSAVQALVKELSSRESVLHVLVNNAGATWGVGIEEYPDSAFTKLLTLNVQRVFTLTQMLLPLLRKAASRNDNGVDDPARIINVGLLR